MEVNMEWNCCRVCLQEADDMVLIFEDDQTVPTVSDKIMQCSMIEIKKGVNLPEQICVQCLSDLNVAYQFRTNCESSAAILNSILESAVIPQTPVPEMRVSLGTGEIYKFRPPSGLNVNKIQSHDHKDEVITDQVEEEKQTVAPKIEMLEEVEDEENYYITGDIEYGILDEPENNPDNDSDDDNEAEEKHNKIEEKQNEIIFQIADVALPKRGRPRKQSQDGGVGCAGADADGDTENRQIIRIKRINDDPKPWKICEICGNRYKYQHALNSHMRRHRNERPFTCEICSKSFVINFELNRHMRTHTGQKPYACKYCERKFSDFGSRIKHERTHTGERPYSCETCGKTFAYSHVLSSHMLTHTGVKNYECPVCSKRFTKAHHLKAHRNTHEKRCITTKILRADPSKTVSLNKSTTCNEPPPVCERRYKNVMTVLTARKNSISETASEKNYEKSEQISVELDGIIID